MWYSPSASVAPPPAVPQGGELPRERFGARQAVGLRGARERRAERFGGRGAELHLDVADGERERADVEVVVSRTAPPIKKRPCVRQPQPEVPVLGDPNAAR